MIWFRGQKQRPDGASGFHSRPHLTIFHPARHSPKPLNEPKLSGSTTNLSVPTPRALVHSAWFDYALVRLGGTEAMDELLGRELYRLSLYADLVPTAPGCDALRIYQSAPFLREDGQLVRIWIYFTLQADDSVNLQHAEAIEEKMDA